MPSINWNGRAVSVTGSDEHVTVLDKAGARLASTDLHAFDYIGSIRAAPVCRNPKGDHDLAVLVTLRATSDRSMLIVYGPDGAVVYQEHLERTGSGNRWAGSMYVASRDGHDLLRCRARPHHPLDMSGRLTTRWSRQRISKRALRLSARR